MAAASLRPPAFARPISYRARERLESHRRLDVVAGSHPRRRRRYRRHGCGRRNGGGNPERRGSPAWFWSRKVLWRHRPISICARPRPIPSCTRNRRRAKPRTRRSIFCRAAASAAAPPSTGPRASVRRQSTLEHWAREFGIQGFSAADLAPWFARMEQRLGIAPWPVAANENNSALRRGANVLGISSGEIQRNVKGCWNLGYCGMGCPTNAKQSMLVTTIPAALARGATLVTRARAWTIEHGNARASTLHCVGLDPGGTDPTARKITVRAPTFIVSAGAIGSPALLIRSKAPDPHGVVGKRTFLHPTVVSAALMPDRVDGFAGAPQSIYSDHYLERPARRSAGIQARGAAAASDSRRDNACRGMASHTRTGCASSLTCTFSSR